jgi:hypothetical protein
MSNIYSLDAKLSQTASSVPAKQKHKQYVIHSQTPFHHQQKPKSQ